MKSILSVALLTGCLVFLLSSVAFGQKSTKTEKHIKMVKVGDDGKKNELDTVISGDQIFVWNGDTIGGGKELKWISKDDFKMDSIHQNFDMNFEYKIDDDGEGNVFIMKSGKGGEHIMMPPMGPNAPFPPHGPHVMMFKTQKNKNVIDLADPGIISYDKKLLKNGTEKITIVRKQVPEGEEIEEEVILQSPHSSNAIFFGDSPKQVKTIRVIKNEDGTTEVIEDENVIHMEGNEGTAKFIGDDGKVIIIKEIKEGGEKKVEVTVEEEKEKK